MFSFISKSAQSTFLPCYECRDFFKHVCLHKELHRSFVNFMRHFFPPHITSKECLMKIRQNCRSHYFTPFMRKNGTHSFYMTSYHKLKKARVVEIYDWHTSLRVDMVVVIHNDLLIQWRHIPMCQFSFCSNIVLISITLNYFAKIRVLKVIYFHLPIHPINE